MQSCSCRISSAASHCYTSDLFNSYTSGVLPKAAPLCTQVRLCLSGGREPIHCISPFVIPSKISALPSLMPEQTISPPSGSVQSTSGSVQSTSGFGCQLLQASPRSCQGFLCFMQA